jgi:hypothetical protein
MHNIYITYYMSCFSSSSLDKHCRGNGRDKDTLNRDKDTLNSYRDTNTPCVDVSHLRDWQISVGCIACPVPSRVLVA